MRKAKIVTPKIFTINWDKTRRFADLQDPKEAKKPVIAVPIFAPIVIAIAIGKVRAPCIARAMLRAIVTELACTIAVNIAPARIPMTILPL